MFWMHLSKRKSHWKTCTQLKLQTDGLEKKDKIYIDLAIWTKWPFGLSSAEWTFTQSGFFECPMLLFPVVVLKIWASKLLVHSGEMAHIDMFWGKIQLEHSSALWLMSVSLSGWLNCFTSRQAGWTASLSYTMPMKWPISMLEHSVIFFSWLIDCLQNRLCSYALLFYFQTYLPTFISIICYTLLYCTYWWNAIKFCIIAKNSV